MTKRVLITGGAHGIGKAIANRCTQSGFEVIVLDRDATSGLSFQCDLTDWQATREALKAALKTGPITHLVNNVGAVFPNSVENQTLQELNDAWRLNSVAAANCVQLLLPSMKAAKHGRIVSIASRALLGKEHRLAYAASKGALQSMNKVWALELAKYGITANVVAPGPIKTELFERANPADSERTLAIKSSVPVGRMGTPEEVAHAACFFLGEQTGFITGQTLYVCGGITIGGLA